MTWGFGNASGPRSNPPDSNPYIHLRPQTPSHTSHRNIEASQSTYSPPLDFQSNYSAVGPSHPPAAAMRSFDSQTHQRPSMATPSHPSKHQGPHLSTTTAPLGYLKRATSSELQSTDENSARNSRRRDTRPSDMVFEGRFQSVPQRTSPPVLSGNHYSREIVRPVVEVQRQRPPGPLFDDDIQPVPHRMRSPPSFPGNYSSVKKVGHFMELQRPSGAIFNDHMQSVSQGTRSPPQFPGQNRTGDKVAPSFESSRSVLSPPVWGNQTRPASKYNNTWFGQDQSPPNSRRHVSVTRVDAQAGKKTRSPLVPSAKEDTSPYQENSRFSRHGSMRPSVPPPGSRTRSNDLNNFTEFGDSEIPHMFPSTARSINNNDGAINTNSPSPKRSHLVSTAQIFQRNPSSQDKSEQPFVSLPRFINMTNSSNDRYESPTFGVPRMSLPPVQNNEDKSFTNKPTNVPAPKRNRSPPLISSDRAQGYSSPLDDREREMQAKAKRLARFKVELSQPVDDSTGIGNSALPTRQNTGGTLSADVDGDFSDTVLPDHEVPKSTTVITGLCPDMCPVSEREERERKGDLDRYERLDGDRNQTNKSLAVKKYNRTAEREANLIRPMPVLQKTIDYLLYLLDQPYDEKFLGLYNFLWDRMRAIRMDLRMQHLFNLDSITMLEQMIRLHIIAMHELCEYTKGEGFSEGFDAHLNIEQMNKTSVELFQLYDDHRKKRLNVPTEKEFRGYYALLKLDKHPGYKVEPAELSHDLSKMTPEIRQTQEVLFARDVARACRTGNFIAFFRLARKASYLQACLMHAHFAKLRTQALASLHSGLQSNQGIPVALIAKWLAMEGEDVESLLEYHGFLIRDFDEPYMVKDGQFLNSEDDFPLKCSELVHSKKAEMISEDVSSSISTMSSFAIEAIEDPTINSGQEPRPVLCINMVSLSPNIPVDEVMNDNEFSPSPKSSTQVKPFMNAPSFNRNGEKTEQMAHISPPSWDISSAVSSPKSPQAIARSIGKSPFSSAFRNSFERKSQVNDEAIPNQEKLESPRNDSTTDNSLSEMVADDIIEDKQLADIHYQDVELDEVGPTYDEEVAQAKLRLIFRLWRRHSLRRKVLREERQLASVAALSSLSLGPSIRQRIDQPSTSSALSIDLIANERYERHGKSWSNLNVSEVIADALSGKSSSSKCYCWKMILCSQIQASNSVAVSWLHSKLMPMKKEGGNDLITSSTDFSIWKKWIPDKNGGASICYLSVLKEAEFGNLRETILGSSAVLFLISEGFSMEMERLRLHNFVSSLPSNSYLPLLILIDSYDKSSNSSTVIADQLALNNIDKSLISDYSVIFLKKNQNLEDFDGFFSDEELRRGLKWLANHSPLPPKVRCVKMWDLIGAHLDPSMRVLDEIGPYEVGPDHCISAFNEALNKTIANVVNASNENRCSWPCPEIDSIDKTSIEYEMVSLHLPLTGWSSSDRIDQLMFALEGTKLPVFEDEFSWLYKGSNSRNELENQKQLLENCLIKYLEQTSNTMGTSLAANEARAMLQKSAQLELHSSTYYIVPIWVQIFQRIFNWRLMGISTEATSTAYVLEHDMNILDLGLEKSSVVEKSSSHDLNRPSLDEMIESCTEIEVFKHLPITVSGGSKAVKFTDSGNSIIEELRFEEDDILQETINTEIIDQRSNETTDEMVKGWKSTMEAGRLSKLLEHCNILQDKIDKKLSIYF